MREYRLAVVTAAAALVLAAIGGLVEGSPVLACPDWPLCQGSPLPDATRPVLVEQGHRLAALAVAVLTVVLAALVMRTRADAGIRRLALAAVGVVSVQAALGAITVVFGLPTLARLAHLATAMTFFALVVPLAARLRPSPGAAAGPERRDPAARPAVP